MYERSDLLGQSLFLSILTTKTMWSLIKGFFLLFLFLRMSLLKKREKSGSSLWNLIAVPIAEKLFNPL